MRVRDLADELPSFAVDNILEKGIEELNEPQELAVDHGLFEGKSLLVASPTASGKTLIATLAMTKSLLGNENKKALYLVPLKALASEKYQDYRDFFADSELEVALSLGDKDSADSWLETKDLIILTVEKLDSLLRHNPSWIKDVGIVVEDEIHLLNDPSRGPTLEVTLTRLRQLIDFQLIGLSATINNADALADWLDCELVKSDYRPVELEKGIYWDGNIEFYRSPPDKEASTTDFKTGKQQLEEERAKDDVETRSIANKYGRGTMNLLRDSLKDDKQAINFVRSRKSAEKEAERLGKVTEEFKSTEEQQQLEKIADKVKNALSSPTKQCKRLAKCVRKGSAFHHAGLCVAGDTDILKSDGTFEKMANFLNSSPAEVIGLNRFELGVVEVEGKYEMGRKPLLRITTRTGNEIKVSKNHPLPVLGAKGIAWRKAKNLSSSDYLARPRRLDFNIEAPSLRKLIGGDARLYRKYDRVKELASDQLLSDEELNYRESYGKDRNMSVSSFRQLCDVAEESPNQYLDQVMSLGGQKPVKIPEKVDKGLCWMVGAVAGDGGIDRSTISLSGSCRALIEKFKSIAHEKFAREVTLFQREDGVWTASLNCKVLADIIDSYFGVSADSKLENLEVPSVALPDELVGSYLSGLFDTDGSVSPRLNDRGSPCVEFYSANKRFVSQLKTSLLRFGIIAYEGEREVKGRENEIGGQVVKTQGNIYRLTIYGRDQLKKFQTEIGFNHPEKSRKLNEAIAKNPEGGRGQLDVIPTGLGERIKQVRQSGEISLQDLEPEIPKATLSRYENSKNPMKRSTFQKLARKLDDKLLQDLAFSDIFWDKIEQIDSQEEETLYDLSTTSENFIANGVIAHNTSEQRSLIEDHFRQGTIKSISATPTLAMGLSLPAHRIILRDLKRYSSSGLDWIPILEYYQMAGRAGRPEHHDEGQAIAIAKSAQDKEKIIDRYIFGQPEKIYSKLAVEPVLRTHILSLVVTGFAPNQEKLLDFFSKTFYADQYQDLQELNQKILDVLRKLEDYEFLELNEKQLEATRLGKRVAKLYLDPYTAHYLLTNIRESAIDQKKPINLFYLLANCVEMKPLLRVRSSEEDQVQDLAAQAEDHIEQEVPEPWDFDYEPHLRAVKTAFVLYSWVNEIGEDKLMDKFNVTPGTLRAKVDNADWLLYSLRELARLKGWKQKSKRAEKVRIRLQQGIKQELLSLVEFDQIGRVRARRLFDNEIKGRDDIRQAPFEKLKKILGKKTAEKLKEQVGVDNVFDREDITSYFD